MKKYTKLLVFILFIMILIVFKTSVFASDYFSATDEELEKAFDIYLYSNQTNGLEFEGKYLFGVENNVPYYNHPLDHTIYITKIKRASLSSDGYMVGWCYDCENEFNYLRKKILKNKYNDPAFNDLPDTWEEYRYREGGYENNFSNLPFENLEEGLELGNPEIDFAPYIKLTIPRLKKVEVTNARTYTFDQYLKIIKDKNYKYPYQFINSKVVDVNGNSIKSYYEIENYMEEGVLGRHKIKIELTRTIEDYFYSLKQKNYYLTIKPPIARIVKIRMAGDGVHFDANSYTSVNNYKLLLKYSKNGPNAYYNYVCEYEYSYNKNMKNSKKIYETDGGLYGIKFNKDLYVRVRTLNNSIDGKKIYSDWSPIVHIKTKEYPEWTIDNPVYKIVYKKTKFKGLYKLKFSYPRK